MPLLLLLLLACSSDPADSGGALDSAHPLTCALPTSTPPACDSGPLVRDSVVPGPGDAQHDAALADRAAAVDRQANGLTAWAAGATCELTIADAADRALVEDYVLGGSSEDALADGLDPAALVDSWAKVAGAYGGVSIAADAWRYAALRDEGAPCEQVQAAKARLLVALDTLHLAQGITGVSGVIARGFARKDLPGAGETETTPLFDEAGDPLPEEKDNGTWREDNSGGLYADYAWEDSCSRDQYIGWAAGIAAAWEAIHADPDVPQDDKDRLQADARALLASLMTVQESGYDLEIRDADGRMTYHGILHHESVDRAYVPGAQNAPNALMSLGIVAGLALAAEDPAVDAWLADDLIGTRDLPGIVRDNLLLQGNFGSGTNYSGTNMIFIGGLLAWRYLCDEQARSDIATGLAELYSSEGKDARPVEQEQALYDLVGALVAGGGLAVVGSEVGGGAGADPTAAAKTARVLGDFRGPPFWSEGVENCDADEIASGSCTLDDGSVVELLGEVGWNDSLVAAQPVPMSVRPPSNYYWRSNPYQVNGDGDGSSLYPNADWRLVYWAGRWFQR